MTGPVDASDLSIVIPYRADVPERRENLAAVLRHLSASLHGVEVIVIEDGPDPRAAGLPEVPGLRHVARENGGGFHRTALLNLGIGALSDRPFAASWDTDVLIPAPAMARALALLRGGAGLVYPYDGRFYDLRGEARARQLATPAPEALTDLPPPPKWWQRPGEITCLHSASVGGAVLFDRAEYARTGGYHEAFRAWGFEDAEIRERMEKLDVRVARVAGSPLIHLWHPRKRHGGAWYRAARRNRALYRYMVGLDRAELERMIAAGDLRRDMAAPGGFARRPARRAGP